MWDKRVAKFNRASCDKRTLPCRGRNFSDTDEIFSSHRSSEISKTLRVSYSTMTCEAFGNINQCVSDLELSRPF